MNQGVSEGMISIENRKGWRWEDVTAGGITLKVVELPSNYVLNMIGGVRGEHQGNSILVPSGWMGNECRTAGHRRDIREGFISNSRSRVGWGGGKCLLKRTP